MRTNAMVLMVALATAGCAAHAARDPAPAASVAASAQPATAANLDGTEWRFVEVGGTPVPAGVTATLHLRNGHASGKAGCNSYGASWQMSTDGSATFGQAMSTRMACLTPAGVMQVERGVFAALQHTTRVEREGDSLILLDASGKPLAKLVSTGTP